MTNEYAVPARREVTVTRDGDPVATRTVSLAGGDTRTLSIPVEFPESGEYRLGVAGAESTRITVTGADEQTASRATRSDGDAVDGAAPGFGATLAVLALVVFVGIRRR